MTARSQGNDHGFTLIEAMVSLFVFLALLGAVFTVYAPSRVIYARGTIKADVQQNARLGMGQMARQMRMAGFFPENFRTPPPGTPLVNAVLLATDQAVAIHGDLDDSDATNVFLFCLDGDVLRRGRAAANLVDAYTCADGEVLAENVIDLQFTYYDAAGNPVPNPPSAPFQLDNQDVGSIPNLADTSQRDSIRRVVVTLTAEIEAPQRGPQTYALTSDIWLRNGG